MIRGRRREEKGGEGRRREEKGGEGKRREEKGGEGRKGDGSYQSSPSMHTGGSSEMKGNLICCSFPVRVNL